MFSDMKLSSTFQFVEDFCTFEKNSMIFLLFFPHFNNFSIPVGYWKSLPHLSWTHFRNVFEYEIIYHISVFWKISVSLEKIPHSSWTNFMNVFQYEIIFYISVCGRFLYGWKKCHALFLPHFNHSSVGYWKSLPHLCWTHFRNVFQYEIIFHISVCGRFL